jgi:hypothetical protein
VYTVKKVHMPNADGLHNYIITLKWHVAPNRRNR